jgi:UDP-N-acetyl-2-amino-2-deoxyglucuronate dehydrogenase
LTGKKVYTILQLRLHDAIIKLKDQIDSNKSNKKYEVDLNYITSRGNWYLSSWKNDFSKSGGVALNIGIHFFDMLCWIFGEMIDVKLNEYNSKKAAGVLELKNAIVHWNLSIDSNDLPKEAVEKGSRTFRSIKINNNEFEFSEGFTELHTKSYEGVLDGKGFSLDDALPAIRIAEKVNQLAFNFKQTY